MTLFLVVPFTMSFRTVNGIELHKLVVIEVLAANLLGAGTPIGNPQNLFLYARGGFSLASFLKTQLPLVGVSAVFLAAVILLFVPRREVTPPATAAFDVDPVLAGGFFLLLAPAVTGPQGFNGLLYGVTAGACGSPIGSIANLIGAQIYVAEGGEPRSFWRFFCGVSAVFLIALLVSAVLFLRLRRG